jgi:hypothetical protein
VFAVRTNHMPVSRQLTCSVHRARAGALGICLVVVTGLNWPVVVWSTRESRHDTLWVLDVDGTDQHRQRS